MPRQSARRRAGSRESATRRTPPRRRISRTGAAAGTGITVVNIIPQSLSFERNQDSEPNLAVNPANPLQMAASAFTPNPSGTGAAPIFVSTDGGISWVLNAIVPSQRMTADITLRFAATSGILYAGIIRTPIVGNTPRLNVLRSKNFLSSTPMEVLVDRKGQGVDQPYVQATSRSAKDLVIVGDNDFNQPNGRTATLDVLADAGGAKPKKVTIDIERRNPTPGGGVDAPSIRPVLHPDGTVYGAFLHMVAASGPGFGLRRYDVIVVRDDHAGAGAPPFAALTDPSDDLPGRRVIRNRLIPWAPIDPWSPGPLGQERIGSTLSLAVDPRPGKSGVVYVAWADRVGTNDYTLHLRRSTDRGATWSSGDLLTVPNATNPAIAVNSAGKIAFLYQQLTGPYVPGVVSAANRWVTHLRRSIDGASWDDAILSSAPANLPVAHGLPYLGDYVHLLAVGKDFYGVFSANNTPDPSNFPNGVVFQRNHDFATRRLLSVDGATPVDVSIDPFFFKAIVSSSP